MDVLVLMNNIGIYSYEDLREKELISGDFVFDDDPLEYRQVISESSGLLLEFSKSTSLLAKVEVENIESDKNLLPLPFKPDMHRDAVLNLLGEPVFSKPPRKIINIQTGGVDQFYWGGDNKISVLVYYHPETKKISTVAFKPTSNVSWGRQG